MKRSVERKLSDKIRSFENVLTSAEGFILRNATSLRERLLVLVDRLAAWEVSDRRRTKR